MAPPACAESDDSPPNMIPDNQGESGRPGSFNIAPTPHPPPIPCEIFTIAGGGCGSFGLFLPVFDYVLVTASCEPLFATPSLYIEGEELRSELTGVRSSRLFS